MRCVYDCDEDAKYIVHTLVKSMRKRAKGEVISDIGEFADGVCGKHIEIAKRWSGFLRYEGVTT